MECLIFERVNAVRMVMYDFHITFATTQRRIHTPNTLIVNNDIALLESISVPLT
jgi:hypothetical protein